MRYRASEVLKKHFSGQELALAMALILGFQEHLDELPSEAVHQPTLRDALLRSGTIHLLAISGLHVGIIAGLIFFLLRAVGIGPMAASLGVILFMVSYAFLVGARPPQLCRQCLFTSNELGECSGSGVDIIIVGPPR